MKDDAFFIVAAAVIRMFCCNPFEIKSTDKVYMVDHQQIKLQNG